MFARIDAFMCSSTGNRRPDKRCRNSTCARQPRDLSKVINSTPSTPPIKPNSVRPMIHVMAVLGQAAWIDRTTARVWQQSPIADSRITQIASGGAGG